MSWPEKRKSETRQRIVEAAAKVLRQRGVESVSVADVMREAGLTHGGFYAHFASKDELISAALARASEEANLLLAHSRASDQGGNALLAAANRYLSAGHFAHPELGCPLAAIGPELSRGDKQVRKTLAEGIRARLRGLGDLVSKKKSEEKRRRLAAGALASMVGGLIVARGLKGPEAEQFLEDCRSFLKEACEDSAD